MQLKKYVSISAMFLMIACNNASNQTEKDGDTIVQQKNTSPLIKLGFKDSKLQNIYASYILLKNALVATNASEAQVAAKGLARELKTYSGCENTAIIANKIENTKDIGEQRKQFTALSTDVIALFKHVELTAGTIYIQHCPMANNGDGGDWLSSEKNIQNPYYGSEMMECGSVIEEIKTE